MNTTKHIENLWSILEWDKSVLILFDSHYNLIKQKSGITGLQASERAHVDDLFETQTTKKLSTIFDQLNPAEKPVTFQCVLKNLNETFPAVAKLFISQDGEKYYFISNYKKTAAFYQNLSLTELEEQFRMIFQNSPDGIFIMDGEKILDCNPAAEKLYGASRDDILDKSPYDLSPEKQENGESSEKLAKEYISTALQGTPLNFEWTHITATGVPFSAEITLTPVKFKNKPIIQAIIRDISIRKKNDLIQKAILDIGQASNEAENLDTLYATIHAVIAKLMLAENLYIALYDEKNDLITFPYFVDLYDDQPEPRKPGKGFTEYVLKKGETALLSPEEIDVLYDKGIVNLLGSESIDWLGVPLKVKGNTIGVLAVQSYDTDKRYTTTDANILEFVSTQIASVIHRKQYEDEILDSQQKLEEMNASKDRLFSIIAHDLKSPFTALLGFSELMSIEAEMLSKDEVKSYSESIYKVARNVHNLLENLLHWSRFQTGRFTLKQEEIKIKPLFNEVINLFGNNAKSKNIKLTGYCNEDDVAFADIGMIQSTLRNLVSNAIKFTNDGGQITLSARKDDTFLYITVEDNGVGIGKANISKIFRIDLQYTTSGTSNEKGTGLGLLLTKEMVEKNGGEITVESKRGSGSKFTFSIPLNNATKE